MMVKRKSAVMVPVSPETFNKLRLIQREIGSTDLDETIEYLIEKSMLCRSKVKRRRLF